MDASSDYSDVTKSNSVGSVEKSLDDRFKSMSLQGHSSSVPTYVGRTCTTLRAPTTQTEHVLRRVLTQPLPTMSTRTKQPIPQTIACHDAAGLIVALNKSDISQFNEKFGFIIQEIHKHHYQLKFPHAFTQPEYRLMVESFFPKLAMAATPGAKFYLHFTSEALTSCNDFFENLCSCLKGKEISIQFDLSGYVEAIRSVDFFDHAKLTVNGLLKIFKIADQFQSVDFTNCSGIAETTFLTLLQKCSNTKELILSGCKQITDDNFISMCTYLPKLVACTLLGCSSLTDRAFIALVDKCPRLTIFDASETELTDAFFVHLGKSGRSLAKISLAYCDAITDTSLFVIARWQPPLYSLDVRYCSKITESGIQEVYPNVTHELLVEGLNDHCQGYQKIDATPQNYSLNTSLSRNNELQLLEFRQYLQTFFKNSTAQVIGDWLKITIGKAKDEELLFLDQTLFHDFMPFIQKHCVACTIGLSAFAQDRCKAHYKFLQEIAPCVMHLQCVEEIVVFSSEYPEKHCWQFPRLENLDFSGCSHFELLFQTIIGLQAKTVKLKGCKGIAVQTLARIVNKNFPKLAELDVRGVVSTYQELLLLDKAFSHDLFIKCRPCEHLFVAHFSPEDVLQLLKVLCREPEVHDDAIYALSTTVTCTKQNVANLLQFAYDLRILQTITTTCKTFLFETFGNMSFELSYEDTYFTLTIYSQFFASHERHEEFAQFLKVNLHKKNIYLKLHSASDTTILKILDLLQGSAIIGLSYVYEKALPSPKVIPKVAPRSANTSKRPFLPFSKSKQDRDSIISTDFADVLTFSMFWGFLKSPQCSSLKSLSLENLGSDDITSFLESATTSLQLEKLTLKSCELSGLQFKKILEIHKNLVSLSIINSPNFSSCDLEELNFACAVRDLDLSHCQSITRVHALMRSMPQLARLNVSHTGVEDTFLQGFYLHSLHALNLSYTAISNTTLGSVSFEVSELVLDGTKITHEGISSLQATPLHLKLSRLSLKGCPYLNHTEDDAFKLLAQIARVCPNLRHLDVSNNGCVSEAGILSLLHGCDHIETITTVHCRALMHLYNKLSQDNKSKKVHFNFSDSQCFSQHTLEICMRKAPCATDLFIDGFSRISEVSFKQIMEFYLQRNHLKKIALQGFTTDISHYLQEARRCFPSLQVLKLSGAVTDETVYDITHFKHLKHLEIRNTLSGTAVKPCTQVTIGSLVFGALEVLVLEQIFALTIPTLDILLQQVPKLCYLELVTCQNSDTQTFTMGQIDLLHRKYRSRLTIRYRYYDSQRRICSTLFPKSDG